MKKAGKKRGRKAGSGFSANSGYKEMVRTGWTYGTEEEQNWLMREIGRGTDGPPTKKAECRRHLHMNKYQQEVYLDHLFQN